MRRTRRWGLLFAVMLVGAVGVAGAQSPPPASTPDATVAAAPAPLPEIPFAAANAWAVPVASAADAWGGERTGHEATLSDRVVTYTIDAKLDATHHAVDGKQRMTWRNRSDRPVGVVYFHLYLNAFQNDGSTWFAERKVLTAHGRSRGAAVLKDGQWGFIDLQRVAQDGVPLKWRFVQPDGGPATDQTVARVDLATPVPAGGTLTLDIDFRSQLPRVVERTGWFGDFNLVGQWFPKIGVLELPGERGATAPRWNVHEFHFNSEFYADFGAYDVHITAPDDYVVGAVGVQQGEPVRANGMATWHFTQGDVHDFAWVAAKGYKTLAGQWQGPGSPAVAVRVIYPPEYAASAAPSLRATTDSLTYFSDTLGPYPYATVTVVIPPYNASEAGGMEYPTFFTAEGYAKVEAGTATQYSLDFVNIHEFGHGYFYGILASNEFEEPMLDEGMNQYWDDRMLSDRKQPLHMASGWMKRLGITPTLSSFVMDRLGAGLAWGADPLGQNSWDRLSGSSYGTVYMRTATAMHDLEQRVGREAMARGMRTYYQRWRFRHPSVADLRDALIAGTGQARVVNDIFARYVFGTDSIDDRVSNIDTREVLPAAGSFVRNGKRMEVSKEQHAKDIAKQRTAWHKAHPKAKHGSGPFPWLSTVTVTRHGAPVPQLLRVKFADGSQRDLHWDDGRRWARFDFSAATKVVSAELDPERKILLDANKLNDSRTVEANGAASRRWSADAAALLQVLHSLLGAL